MGMFGTLGTRGSGAFGMLTQDEATKLQYGIDPGKKLSDYEAADNAAAGSYAMKDGGIDVGGTFQQNNREHARFNKQNGGMGGSSRGRGAGGIFGMMGSALKGGM